jgi:nucleoside 2-deoxyribosyltransferase
MIEAQLVYLAGPIYEQDDTCIRWRKATHKLLMKKNVMCMKPTDADYRGRETIAGIPKQIVEGDKKSIMYCDTILAKCDHPSYGTAMEIYFAWSLRKQIIVVTNSYSPWIRYHADHIFPTLEEAIENIEFPDFDPGITK